MIVFRVLTRKVKQMKWNDFLEGTSVFKISGMTKNFLQTTNFRKNFEKKMY